MSTVRYSAEKAAQLILDLRSDTEISDLPDEDDPDFEINYEALPSNTGWTEPDVKTEEENEHSYAQKSIEKNSNASLTEKIFHLMVLKKDQAVGNNERFVDVCMNHHSMQLL